MKTKIININKKEIKYINLDCVVVGTGASGYNCAISLNKMEVTDIAIITENVNCGTSRNTGSDKQTYYKLDICGGLADSPYIMAKDIFKGKCVDGDNALAESANSLYCFFRLCEQGVPFPTDNLGCYIGYKTDHDDSKRATSAGPLTSKIMTEKLQQEAERLNIPILNKLFVVDIIKNNEKAIGLVCIDTNTVSPDQEQNLVIINCSNIIFATGGPASVYKNTVYPFGHHGSSGVLFSSGVEGQNLTEWQYGLASVNPRWNVSGTYMQVLPSIISIDEKGNRYDFLLEYFGDEYKAMSAVFKKGYEWPFDCNKIKSGSSIIDLLVYKEAVLKNRKVYMDFTKNPFNIKSIDFEKLSKEAYEYLKSCNACFGTPAERLILMNQPAFDLYKSKGVDLNKDLLEISLSAQHCNGGVSVDKWWQSSLKGLFVVGEAAGTHGVYRPGGSALNSGQVGSYRAALYISNNKNASLEETEFFTICEKQINNHINLINNCFCGKHYAKDLIEQLQTEMTSYAGPIRNKFKFKELLEKRELLVNNFYDTIKIEKSSDLKYMYMLYDILIAQMMFITSMSEFTQNGGDSRGSAIYINNDIFDFNLDTGEKDDKIQQLSYSNGKINSFERAVRPIPTQEGSFESLWREYRENKGVY